MFHLFPFRGCRQERGMSRQDAEDVIGKMAKYDEFFVNLMMNEELGLQVCVSPKQVCRYCLSAIHGRTSAPASVDPPR